MTQGFSWYELRALDPDHAADFYGSLGLDFRVDRKRHVLYLHDRPAGEVTTLPEQARKAGAPPHWLGHLHARDVEGMAARCVAHGGERLGPTRRSLDGFEVAGLRDPFGAVVGVTSRDVGAPVAWHELHTPERMLATSFYGELFGAHVVSAIEAAEDLGVFELFAFPGAHRVAGGVLSTKGRPGVHPQWLFYFRVRDMERALDETALRGGRVLHGPRSMPGGLRGAVCEDPEGASFGLCAT